MKKFIIIFAHYAAVSFVAVLTSTIAFSIYTPLFSEIQRPSFYLGFGLALTLIIVALIFNKFENWVLNRIEKRTRNKLYKRICAVLPHYENDSDEVIIETEGAFVLTVGDLRATKKRMEEQGWDS